MGKKINIVFPPLNLQALSDLIKYIQQGISLMHDLLALLPVVDPVLVVRVTGDQLLEALENGVNK